MLWVLWLAACKSPCDKAADYLVDDCKIVAAASDEVESECDEGSIAACEAECTLATDCSVLVPPGAMTGDVFTEFLKAVEVYDGCLAACQPVVIDTEPEDTSAVY